MKAAFDARAWTSPQLRFASLAVFLIATVALQKRNRNCSSVAF
jgi:hypothetical protein